MFQVVLLSLFLFTQNSSAKAKEILPPCSEPLSSPWVAIPRERITRHRAYFAANEVELKGKTVRVSMATRNESITGSIQEVEMDKNGSLSKLWIASDEFTLMTISDMDIDQLFLNPAEFSKSDLVNTYYSNRSRVKSSDIIHTKKYALVHKSKRQKKVDVGYIGYERWMGLYYYTVTHAGGFVQWIPIDNMVAIYDVE